MANDAKIQVQKIQARIDALKKKREKKLAQADRELEKTNREAANRHNRSYKEVMQEYDPKIAELAEQRKAAEREARRAQDPVKR